MPYPGHNVRKKLIFTGATLVQIPLDYVAIERLKIFHHFLVACFFLGELVKKISVKQY